MQYTESFKEVAVSKLLSPNSGGLCQIAENLGVPKSTLFSWKQKYANTSDMKKSDKKSNKSWSVEQKLEAIIKTSQLSEEELGEYLRANGLYSQDIERFKEDLISQAPRKGRPKLDSEVADLRKANKKLEKDLRKTKQALAEQSARIILLKKATKFFAGESK